MALNRPPRGQSLEGGAPSLNNLPQIILQTSFDDSQGHRPILQTQQNAGQPGYVQSKRSLLVLDSRNQSELVMNVGSVNLPVQAGNGIQIGQYGSQKRTRKQEILLHTPVNASQRARQ